MQVNSLRLCFFFFLLLFLSHSPICLLLFSFQPLVECKYRLGLTSAAGTGLQQACGGAAFLSFYTLQMSLLGGGKEGTIKTVLSVAVVVRV